MSFLRLYRRVVALLAPERGLAITLVLANVGLATAAFLGPLLFGRIVDALASSSVHPSHETWQRILLLLAMWGLVGIGGMGTGILVALHADRLSHRRRLAAMSQYFEHALQLSQAFHGATHSGRQLKVMWQGAETLFGVWLSFLRENLATFVALFVLLPLTLFLNWRLGALVVLLVFAVGVLTWFVFRRTHAAQAEVEAHHSALAEQAGDALGNVTLIQSFVRLAAETRKLRSAMDQLIGAQFPVLNWWALLTVLSGASSTITLIAIFALGTSLHLQGKATVGEIVTFMGLATQLIGRMDQAMSFVNRLFFHAPRLAEFFAVLDTPSAVVEKPSTASFGRVRGLVEFERVSLSYGRDRPAVHDLSFVVEPGESVALVGHTGAGKSTAVALLQRLRDPPLGRFASMASTSATSRSNSLRANIGVVFQETCCSIARIADNLRVGRPDASDAELGGRAHGRGARLHPASAGRVQHPGGRARRHAFWRRAPAAGDRPRAAQGSADPDLRRGDQRARRGDRGAGAAGAEDVMRGRTTFVIAHRLSTVREADLILVFENGRIVERGSFSSLLAQGGTFAQLVATQLGPLARTARAS